MCLNIGTPKNINFSFETNGKLMALGVPILKHIRVSYDITDFQWVTSCHKNCMTPHAIALWHVDLTSLAVSMSAMLFHIEIMFILKAIKSQF